MYDIIRDGTVEEHFMEPTLKMKINAGNYSCYDEQKYMEQTKCINNFYMSKLNCTFPWLPAKESTKQSHEQCGSKHYIKDLVNLINEVSTGK